MTTQFAPPLIAASVATVLEAHLSPATTPITTFAPLFIATQLWGAFIPTMATLVMTTILVPSMTVARMANARELKSHAVMAMLARLTCVIQQQVNAIGPTVTVVVAPMAIHAPWVIPVLMVLAHLASPISLATITILVRTMFVSALLAVFTPPTTTALVMTNPSVP